ncbi:MAG: hypothetical protein QOF66_2479 [Mycobacterium sp.]|nr:hypothetical protein [Mycobacterium sp.]
MHPVRTSRHKLPRPPSRGVSPKVVSDRIEHANVGFFLQTYAHVLNNDDREAAEQAASFLVGRSWDPTSDEDRRHDVHKSVHKWHENGPRRVLRGPFCLVAGTGFEPATSGL